MKQKISIFILLSIIVGVSFFSCSKQVESSPSFIFKKSSDKSVVAVVAGEKIQERDLMRGIDAEIFDLENKVYQMKMNRLRALALEKYMTADKRKKGISNDEYMNRFIAPNVKVTKEDISKFALNRKIPKEQLNDMVRGQIKKFLEVEKKKEAVDNWLGEQTKKSPIVVYFPKPQRPTFDVKVTDEDSSWGNKNSKVTVIEYSDFQCPFCSKGADVISELKKMYKGKIRIVFKNFPLPFHPLAKGAAEVALCAGEQGEDYFWKMHDVMFKNQEKLKPSDLLKYATEFGVNKSKLDKCLEGDHMLGKIKDDIAHGQELGIKSTPTFFINGQLLNGALPVESFKEIIDIELSK